MAGVLDGGHLHAQADAQVGNLLLAGKAHGANLAFHPALAKAAGHQDGVKAGQLAHVVGGEGLGVNVVDLDLGMVVDAGVAQGLVERLVGVRQVGVLAAHGDAHRVSWVVHLAHQVVPAGEVGRLGEQLQLHADQLVQTLLVQHAWHLVDGVHVLHGDHAMQRHVREQADLLALVLGDAAVGPAQQGVGLDADLAQLLHRVLGGLGLELACGRDPGHVGEVHEGSVARAHLQAELAGGLQERQGLDVAHRAANFHDRHVHIHRTPADEVLDLVGDVRNDLHGLAQVVAPALFLEHRFVDLAGGEVVGALHPCGDEALVVAEVQIGLGAVVGDEDLTVLEGAHRARIHVEVGVELDEGDGEAARFEDGRQRRGGDALAQRGHHTACDEDKLGHGSWQSAAGTLCFTSPIPAQWEIESIPAGS